jgi:hypothetical protein
MYAWTDKSTSMHNPQLLLFRRIKHINPKPVLRWRVMLEVSQDKGIAMKGLLLGMRTGHPVSKSNKTHNIP